MLKYAEVPQENLDRIGYKPIAATGKRKVFGHQNMGDKPHVWGEIEIDDYPESPEGRALRDFCIEHDIGLREAALLLGISAVHMSNLHRGAATCDWQVVREILASAELLRRLKEKRS